MIKQSKPKIITITAVIKRQRLREERCKHKDNTVMCYRRGNRNPRHKTSPSPSKRSIIHLRIKFGYMNSRRPSKPNLPSAPKPSKLLAPTGLCRTLSSLAYWIPQLVHCINQYQLVLFKLLPKHRITFSQIWVWWDKDLSTSQGCINEEGESRGIWRIKRWRLWMSQSCFSLKILFRSS